ncbi:MAG: tyrosine-type recombinase/integrase [Tenericutes bacterium]|nr:tyrosine-type recombinase/integrase [Mycoplasmatota bacterium]
MNFNSILSSQLERFICEKNSNEYHIKNIVYYLRDFDKYLIEIDYKYNYLIKDVVYNYIDSKENCIDSTKSRYASLLRQLGIYMYNYDNKSYILPHKRYSRNYDFTPHIYTEEEIIKIFDSIKNGYYRTKPKIQRQIYLITKILFSTGMRIGEVLNLKKENFNNIKYTLLLEKTKNNSERLVVINEALSNEIKLYIDDYPSNYEYIFERNYHQKYTPALYGAYFKKIIFKAKIKHNEKWPRVHDIRHTFTVNSFRNAIKRGEDLNSFLPLLSAYLGHTDLSSTYKYLHLTTISFPELREKVSKIVSVEKEIDYDNL